MDILQSVALAAGLAWGSGMRLYAVLFSAGMLGRFGHLDLPSNLQVLENPWVLGVSGILLVIEFLADKIPAVDSLWDSVHTFIRIPAGALLAAMALGDNPDPVWMMLAGLLGGTLTAGVHAAKSGSRALINTSPEPVSNIAASLTEDVMVAGGLFAAFTHPAIFLVLLLMFLILLVWLLPKLWQTIRRVTGLAPRTNLTPPHA
jgi:hypothetical protein